MKIVAVLLFLVFGLPITLAGCAWRWVVEFFDQGYHGLAEDVSDWIHR